MAFEAAVTCESSGSDALTTQRGGRGGRGRGKQLVFCWGQEAATETHQATTAKYSAHKTTQKQKKIPNSPPKTKTGFQNGTLRYNFRWGFFLFFLRRNFATWRPEKRNKTSQRYNNMCEWIAMAAPPPLTRHILRKRKVYIAIFWRKFLSSDFLKKNIWWWEFAIFLSLVKKGPKQYGQGNFLENFPKEIAIFWGNKLWNRQDFGRIWPVFFKLFFWGKSPYLSNGCFCGSSTCNKITRN